MKARPVRRQRVKRDAPKPESFDVRMQKARKLPLSGPGIVITIKLDVLPEWLEHNNLVPMTRGEVVDVVNASPNKRRLPGVLYVKRVRP